MAKQQGKPGDDVSSAPESGTERDETSGAAPSDRGTSSGRDESKGRQGDDPATANEER